MDATQPTADYYRFCPGEEHIKLSNAICRGRRRSHFPNCQGCQFDIEDSSLAAAAPVTKPETVSQIESVFRREGVSATVPAPLSEDVAWRIGHATAQYLHAKLRGYDRADPSARSVVTGRDMRTHSPVLQEALIEGIRAAGLDVLDIGTVDTPQLYFAVDHARACGGIQTTGGHRPDDYNGFIICAAKAVPITAETGLASVRDLAARVPRHQTGTTARLTCRDFSQPYADFVRSVFLDESAPTRRLKVVVDAANGMAGQWLPIIFDGVGGLRFIPLNWEHDGHFQHDPDPLQLRNTREMRKMLKQRKADLGVCFSGDAAQCVFVDEKGCIVPSDMIAALLARMFIEREPGATILLDLRSSRAALEEIQRAGGVPILERVSHILMKKSMSERKAVFGADLSGRFYFRDAFSCESAFLAFAQILNLLRRTRRNLSELVRPIRRYRSSGELQFQCPDTVRAISEVASAHSDAETDHLDGLTVRYADWWVNIRPDTSESLLRVTLEARTRKLVEERLAQLSPFLGRRA